MSGEKWERLARVYAAVVGAMDFATGIGLLAMPAVTLGAMGARVPGREAQVFVSFAGVFVLAVGASYLWAATRGPAVRRTVLGVTIFFRTGAGLFAAVGVAQGVLDAAWWTVAATDLACVVVQLGLLAKGVGRDDRK